MQPQALQLESQVDAREKINIKKVEGFLVPWFIMVRTLYSTHDGCTRVVERDHTQQRFLKKRWQSSDRTL